MNNKQLIIRTVVTFTALAVVGISVAVTSQVVLDDFAQNLLISIGSTLFGSGLTFFLVRMFTLSD